MKERILVDEYCKIVKYVKKQIISILCLTEIIGTLILLKKNKKELDKVKKLLDKNIELFALMNQWVRIKQEGKSISSYFRENGYKKIVIYGMGNVGKTLVRELRGTELEIAYIIDKNAENIYTDIEKKSDIDSKYEVDAVIVTAIASYNEIKEEIKRKVVFPIISLRDILDDV